MSEDKQEYKIKNPQQKYVEVIVSSLERLSDEIEGDKNRETIKHAIQTIKLLNNEQKILRETMKEIKKFTEIF